MRFREGKGEKNKGKGAKGKHVVPIPSPYLPSHLLSVHSSSLFLSLPFRLHSFSPFPPFGVPSVNLESGSTAQVLSQGMEEGGERGEGEEKRRWCMGKENVEEVRERRE